MIPLIGYANRWSARPGERVAVKVSCSMKPKYRAELVEILSADANPAGPGVRYGDPTLIGEYPARVQATKSGSYGLVELGDVTQTPFDCTFTIRVQPWLVTSSEQAIACLIGAQCVLLVLTDQSTAVKIDDTAKIQLPAMRRGQWYELRLVISASSLTLHQIPITGRGEGGLAASSELNIGAILTKRVVIGAASECPNGRYSRFFNGRLEDPALIFGCISEDKPIDLQMVPGDSVLHWWDFSLDVSTDVLSDRGRRRAHGKTVNLPMRAVCGSRWSGKYVDWKQGARDYAAIHFHEDDLYDCGWETDFSITIPGDLRSGIYGIRLRAREEEDVIPLFVLPRRGVPESRVALLVPTFTYQAYANYDRGNCDGAYRERRALWHAYPHHPAEHPEFGRSTYDHHSDGSGIVYSSARRPILTCRPGFIAYLDKRGSGLRHFAADMHIADWMHARGMQFDVLTDHDVHDEGCALLAPYACVLTGTHPEYHTLQSLDALQHYVDAGGNLVYLGGNGFYWKIARSATLPDVIEVRRAEGGTRAWASEPGEYYHALDGSYGGLWRRNRRPPQQLTGVGFSAQGAFEGSYYRRLPMSYDSSLAWMFEGISEEVLGDFGLSGGGAAGFELDRCDQMLGTPRNAIVVARSEGHQSHYITPEEILSALLGDGSELVRADMTFVDNTISGAVFSVGSITFCGSLFHQEYTNNISRLLENVVRRLSK